MRSGGRSGPKNPDWTTPRWSPAALGDPISSPGSAAGIRCKPEPLAFRGLEDRRTDLRGPVRVPFREDQHRGAIRGGGDRRRGGIEGGRVARTGVGGHDAVEIVLRRADEHPLARVQRQAAEVPESRQRRAGRTPWRARVASGRGRGWLSCTPVSPCEPSPAGLDGNGVGFAGKDSRGGCPGMPGPPRPTGPPGARTACPRGPQPPAGRPHNKRPVPLSNPPNGTWLRRSTCGSRSDRWRFRVSDSLAQKSR